MKRMNVVDGQTPANKAFVDELQDNIEEAIELNQNFMVAYMTNDYYIKETRVTEVLPIDKVESSNGDKLTLNSHAIKIGSGVKHVRISGNVYFYTGTVSGLKTGSIFKNDREVINTIVNASGNVSGGYQHMPIASKIISVIQGDLIKLMVSGTEEDRIRNYPQGTFLCVEVVD